MSAPMPPPVGLHERRATPEQPGTGRSRRTALTIAGIVVVAMAVVAAILFTGEAPVPPPPDVEEPDQVEPQQPEITYDTEPPANWDVTGLATGQEPNVYTGPGTHTLVTGTLAADSAELESTGRIAYVDDVLWREIKVPGATTGWVEARVLTETAPPDVVYDTEPRANWDVTGVAANDQLNVRSSPGVGSPVIAKLGPRAAELESTGRIARVNGALWREIVVPGDGVGWVAAPYLTETRP